MATKEQVTPLSLSSHQFRSDIEDEEMSKQFNLRRRRYIQCCGCLTALLLIMMVVIIVIATVVHIKNPSIKINSVTIQSTKFFSNGSFHTDQNITLLADISVKNPNMASFRYSNTTTTIYYGGTMVGKSTIPAGLLKARRTLRMNMTVDIIPERLLAVPIFASDILSSQTLNVSSHTKIAGRVKILQIFKKSVVVKMNCTFAYNIFTQNMQENCRPRC